MLLHLGDYVRGSKVRIPFSTFNTSNGANISASGLATSDIKVYKGSSTTQRSSTSGYSVSIDFDGIAGVNFVEIDMADDTDAGFFVPGEDYFAVLDSFSVNSQTVAPVAAVWSVENRSASLGKILFRGTLAGYAAGVCTLPSTGSSVNGRYDGCLVVPISGTGSGQGGRYASTDVAYNGTTKELTLATAFVTALSTDTVVLLYAEFAVTATLPEVDSSGRVKADVEAYNDSTAAADGAQTFFEGDPVAPTGDTFQRVGSPSGTSIAEDIAALHAGGDVLRVKSGVTDQYLHFNGPPGCSSFTVRRKRGGNASVAMTTPTVAEDASVPGLYTLLMDEDMTITGGKVTESMTFSISASGFPQLNRSIELFVADLTHILGTALQTGSSATPGIGY